MSEALDALRELVACKDLKDSAEAIHFAGPLSSHGENWKTEYDRLRADYIKRQPVAWQRARDAIAAPEAATDSAITPEQILEFFRRAGINLEPALNTVYTVHGQHDQLIEGARTLIAAATDSAVALTEQQLFELFHTARNAETRADFMRVAKDILAGRTEPTAATDAQHTDAMLSDEQIATIEEAVTKLANIGHIFAGDKQSRRLAKELSSILASRRVDAGNQDAHGSIAPMTPEELAAQPDWIKNARPPEPTK